MSEQLWKKQAAQELPDRPHRLCVINQQLWCCLQDIGIVVFDSELQQQRTIPAGDMGRVYNVAETTNGDVIIAASNGLYRRYNGECSVRLSTAV